VTRKPCRRQTAQLGLIDDVAGQPADNAHEDARATARFLNGSLLEALDSLSERPDKRGTEARRVRPQALPCGLDCTPAQKTLQVGLELSMG
jgi:acetyl-CoA carboxylase alpha subunit